MDGLEVRIDSATRLDEFIANRSGGTRRLIVDVGAQGGFTFLPPSYCRRAKLLGFEPNIDGALSGEDRSSGEGNHVRFRQIEIHPFALWDSDGMHRFYRRTGVGTSSLLPLREGPANRMFRDRDADRSFRDAVLGLVKELDVPVRRLDSILAPTEIVDLLKIDVEGAELRVLEGARSLLDARNVLWIRLEFHTVRYQEGQASLGDLSCFLEQAGFRLLDIEMTGDRYVRGFPQIPPSQDRRLLQSADLVFMLDPERNELDADRLTRMAAVAFASGFLSLGMSLLADSQLFRDAELEQVTRKLSTASRANILMDFALRVLRRSLLQIKSLLGNR